MPDCEELLRLAYLRIKELEENEIAFPLRLWLALEDILDKDTGFYHPDYFALRVYDIDAEINRVITISPQTLICIIADTNSDYKGNTRRKKLLFVKDDSAESGKNIKAYTLNNNKLNFEKLRKGIDPLSHFLHLTSKSAIANVKYYDLSKNNELRINLKGEIPDGIKRIPISNSKANDNIVDDFNKSKEAYDYSILLQKKVLGYKYYIGIDG